MPRYFFHLQDSHEHLDQDGVEMSGADEACEQLIVASGEALKDLGGKFWKSPEWRMWVMDENEATVCAVRFMAE